MSNRNRSKGNRGELIYRNQFRKMGYLWCRTSREESNLLDGCGVDLSNLPVNVQIKTGAHKSLNPTYTLLSMKELLAQTYPKSNPLNSQVNLIIHRLLVERGQRRTKHDEIVYMFWGDWLEFKPEVKRKTTYKLIRKFSFNKQKELIEADTDAIQYTYKHYKMIATTYTYFIQLFKKKYENEQVYRI